MSRRLQDLALTALGVLAAVLVFLALRGADPLPPGDGAASVGTPVASGATTGEDGEDGEDGGGAGDEGADTDAASGTQAAPDGESSGEQSPLEVARAVLQSGTPVTVSALGDSTSNTRQEWVHLWAQELAADRPVSISHWDEGAQDGFVQPDVLSATGSGSPVTIWSGSQGGASAAYPVERLGTTIPESPDLVLLNFGHNHTPQNARSDFQSLLAAIRDAHGDVPVVVCLQQPQAGDANAEVRELIDDWATAEGLATIDIAGAFLAQGELDDLLEDPVHPNQAGSELWAETVTVALSP